MQRINKLNTLKETQNEFSRLIRAYYRDEIETPKFKTLRSYHILIAPFN
jgi:hypothetical protein